jgi:hypothetical protein
MTTWAVFKARLARNLSDNNRDKPTWADDELLDYLNYALVTVAEHTAETKVWSYTLLAASKTVTLPTDVIKLGPVYLNDGLLRPQRGLPGQIFPGATGDYYDWPLLKVLNFKETLPIGAVVKVAYWGYWTPMTMDGTDLPIPRWMEEALDWLCRAHALAKPGVQAARIRPYNTKQDSGSPEDNPALEMARYCRREYERIMANHEAQDQSGWEGN